MRLLSKKHIRNLKWQDYKIFILPILLAVFCIGFLFLNFSLNKNKSFSTNLENENPFVTNQLTRIPRGPKEQPRPEKSIDLKWSLFDDKIYFLQNGNISYFDIQAGFLRNYYSYDRDIYLELPKFFLDKNNWRSVGIKANDTERLIYEVKKGQGNQFFMSVVHSFKNAIHEANNRYWNSLYMVEIDTSSNTSLVKELVNSDKHKMPNLVPFISSISPDNNMLNVYFSCVECEPSHARPHLVYSLANNTYKTLGPVNTFYWNEDSSFAYTLKPKSCIDLVKSYDDFDDYEKCLEDTPVEIITDRI